jgi:uncharacterized membrane protein YgcG
MIILFASITRFRDDPRAAPKTQYVLGTGNGGGDGMDFAAGTEVFQWSSEAVPYGLKPRRIISLWIDASALTAGKNLIIKTPTQQIVVAGGQQTYAIATLNAPFTMSISTNGGTGTVNVTAYDYNVLYTGLPGAGQVASSGTTQSTGGSGGGGGGGYQGGGSGGGGGKGLL